MTKPWETQPYDPKGRPGGDVQDKMPEDLQRTSARAEFAAAVDAGATGRQPGGPPHPVGTRHGGAETAIFGLGQPRPSRRG
ncbi:hypothetical protein GCM10010302_02490 [Streptomyces polychromogenes]|uniref:Uncharacterized protein n=1 Tax=Streptomyces polychromogenes TaxID=67342 RepID=A0ABN0UZX5_9ACTN